MAIWQFDCVLVPRASATDRAREMMRDPEAEGVWRGVSARSLMVAFEGLGEPGTTWSPDTLVWGDEDGTCLQFSYVEDIVEEIRLRIDMRARMRELLQQILAIAERLDLVVVTELGHVLEPHLAAVIDDAEHSEASKFVRDPKGYAPS